MNTVVLSGISDNYLNLLKEIASLSGAKFNVVNDDGYLSDDEFEKINIKMTKIIKEPKNLEVLKRLKDR